MSAPAQQRSWLQRRLDQGFHFAPPPVSPAGWNEDGLGAFPRDTAPAVHVLLPTLANRLTEAGIERLAGNLVARFAELEAWGRGVRLYLIVQFLPGESEPDADARRAGLCSALLAKAHRQGRLEISSLTMPGPGKVLSLNAMLDLVRVSDAEAVILLDDDIEMLPGCLVELVSGYERQAAPTAVGATKIGLPAHGRASRFLFWIKSHTKPAVQYPHACCMMVSLSILKDGFPPELGSDDGFICFELLEPGAQNPLSRLPLLPEARIRHTVGGDGKEIRRRIRRMLLNHYQLLARYDRSKARYYLRHLLFYGFWPVGVRQSGRGFSGALRWSLKLVYFGWFTAIGAELLIRSTLKRPIRHIPWGTDNA